MNQSKNTSNKRVNHPHLNSNGQLLGSISTTTATTPTTIPITGISSSSPPPIHKTSQHYVPHMKQQSSSLPSTPKQHHTPPTSIHSSPTLPSTVNGVGIHSTTTTTTTTTTTKKSNPNKFNQNNLKNNNNNGITNKQQQQHKKGNLNNTNNLNINNNVNNNNINRIVELVSPLNSNIINSNSNNSSNINSSTELFKEDNLLSVEDISEWNSRTLLMHNIMPGMDEKVIREILGTQFKYTFKPAGKPNQLYILFVSSNEAKNCFYNQLKGIRKIDNSGQSCIKICFNNEYKTVIRCTIPDPFPLNSLSPVLSSIMPSTILLSTSSSTTTTPTTASIISNHLNVLTAGTTTAISTTTGTTTASTPTKSNLVATSSSFEPSNFQRNQSSSSALSMSSLTPPLQSTPHSTMINQTSSGHISHMNGNSNSYFQFSNDHNNYYDHQNNIQVMNHEMNIYSTHSPVPSPLVYSQQQSQQQQSQLPPSFQLENQYHHQDSYLPQHLQNLNSPIQSPIQSHHSHHPHHPHHHNSSGSGGGSNTSSSIGFHSHHHSQNSTTSQNSNSGGGSGPKSASTLKATQSKKFLYINELLKLTEENQVIVFPGNQLSTLPRVPTFVFNKLPMKFSYSQHLNYKEKKSTILTGFLREYEDKKKSVGLSQRSNDDGYYGGGNDYHNHSHHHQQSHDYNEVEDEDLYPDEEFFREYPELTEKYENYRVFYYTCYEKTTPTISLISNLGKSYLKERCGRLSVLLLTDWAPDNSFAIGTIQFFNGTPLDLGTISKCILVNHQVFHSDHFDKELVDIYEDWLPTEEEESRRVDLTHLVPVTIDPPSSTDLDDALSFRYLPDEKSDGQSVFEVGIHISDVSYFLEKQSKLDLEAEYRLNTIYLIGGNIPMLPKNLSSHTCSLKLYQKRFCFSLLIKVRSDGTIIDKKYCKSFLRSQGHLSYEKAQRIINRYKSTYENSIGEFNNTEMRFMVGSNEILKGILEEHFTNSKIISTTTSSSPSIFNNNGTNDLETKVNLSIWGLYLVSSLLNNFRKERKEIFDIGGNVQFDLSLDGVPYNIDFQPKLESHVLVQEFMHLANNLAATSLIQKNSEYGILYSTINKPTTTTTGGQETTSTTFDNRKKFFDRLNTFIQKFNPSTNITSQDDWRTIKQKVDDSNQFCTIEQSKAMRRLAMHLMDPSKYMTTSEKRQSYLDGTLDERAQYCHYSSPIRRYCDVNTHRALSLQLTEQVQWTKDCIIKPYWNEDSMEFKRFKASLPLGSQLETLCQKYNDISWKRKISEKLNLLYLTTYLWEQGPLSTPGVVIAMSTKHLVIYLVNFNLEVSSDKSEFLSISLSKNDQYVIEEDDEELFISKQLIVFVSVEPFTLFRNNLIPKIKISKYPPNMKY